MDDDQEGLVRVCTVWMEKVDYVACMRAVGNAEFRATRTRAAIGGSISFPASNNFGVLGDAGAIVVLGLEVDRAQA